MVELALRLSDSQKMQSRILVGRVVALVFDLFFLMCLIVTFIVLKVEQRSINEIYDAVVIFFALTFGILSLMLSVTITYLLVVLRRKGN